MDFLIRFFMIYGVLVGSREAAKWWEHRQRIATPEGALAFYEEQKTQETIKARRAQALSAWDAIYPCYRDAAQTDAERALVESLLQRFKMERYKHKDYQPDPEKLIKVIIELVNTRIYTGRLPLLDKDQLRREMFINTEGIDLSYSPFMLQPDAQVAAA